ncbi:MAG: hypothetical protein P4L11_08460 [Geothrix sp.]|nr:hypothetical protein [Geothrix sp.]
MRQHARSMPQFLLLLMALSLAARAEAPKAGPSSQPYRAGEGKPRVRDTAAGRVYSPHAPGAPAQASRAHRYRAAKQGEGPHKG